MPKRGIIAGFLTMIGLALLLSFKTPTESQSLASTSTTTSSTAASASATTTASASTAATPSATSSSTATATTTPSATTTTSAVSGTFTGSAVGNPYGTVQVQVVISNGKITDVIALSYPTGRESDQINAYAIPILRTEALSAQSAQINNVSGATWTSNGYAQSLQSALDQAGI